MANEISNANTSAVEDSNGNPVEDATIIAVKQEDVSALSQSQATEIQALAKLTNVNGDFTFSEPELYGSTNQYVVVALEESGEQRGTPNYPHVDASGTKLLNSAVHQYDVSELSLSDGDTINTLPDQIGSDDLSAINSPQYSTGEFGSNPAAVLDGTDDGFNVNFTSGVSSAVTVATVVRMDTNTRGAVHDGFSNEFVFDMDHGSDRYLFSSPNDFYDGGNPTTSDEILIHVFDGSSGSFLRRNGAQVTSGALDSVTVGGLHLGQRRDGANSFDGRFAEFVLYNKELSITEIESEEQRLSDKWGIALS